MIDKFSSSPENKLKKINGILRRQFGMVIKSDANMDTLNGIKENVTANITNLKISGKDSKTDPELSKNLLILEGVSAMMEQHQLNEYAGHMGNRYIKVANWLADYAFRNVELGDDLEEAMAEAMKQYRSSKYRFDDVDMQHDVRKNVINKIKQMQVDEDGGFTLERNEDDPWVASKHDEKPKDPATDPEVLGAIRAKYENVSESKVAEMKKNYVKSLRAILENEELQQAEVLVAAQGFSSKLQEIIQKIGRMQNEDMGTVVEQMRQAYGPDVALTFQQDLHAELDQILQELRQAKAQIEQAVEGMTGDGMGNDMAMVGDEMGDELGMDAEMGDDLGMGAEMGDEMGGMGDEMGGELDDLGDDLMGADAAAMDDEPLGRVAKESRVHIVSQIKEMKRQIAELKAIKEGRASKK